MLALINKNNSYCWMILTDWLALFTLNEKIENWLLNHNSNELNESWIVSKNLRIKQSFIDNESVIELQNIDSTICIHLNIIEYKKCYELNSLVQYMFKIMHQNWFVIDEYYNMYVYYCLLKNKNRLTDDDYFTLTAIPSNIDCYRLFCEIPFTCKNKLNNDVSVSANFQ